MNTPLKLDLIDALAVTVTVYGALLVSDTPVVTPLLVGRFAVALVR